MRQALEEIAQRAQEKLRSVCEINELEETRVRLLGKKGELTAILKQMGKLPPEERPLIGQLANEVRARIETAIDQKQKELKAAMLDMKLASEAVDVTMPGKQELIGGRHPLNIVLYDLKEIFLGMGFSFVEGPEVELDLSLIHI